MGLHGGAGTRSSCGSHQQTWWQYCRLRHAGPGKSAPASRAGGRVAGLNGEIGPTQDCRGIPFWGESVPQISLSFRGHGILLGEGQRKERQAALQRGTSSNISLAPRIPSSSTSKEFSPPSTHTGGLKQHGQLGACYLMPREVPTVGNPRRAIWAICASPPPSSLAWHSERGPPNPTRIWRGQEVAEHLPTHTSTPTKPAPKTHQFPAELAQEAVKPSAVHARAKPPARLPGTPGTPLGTAPAGPSRAGWPGSVVLHSLARSLSLSLASPTSGSCAPPLAWRYSQWGWVGLQWPCPLQAGLLGVPTAHSPPLGAGLELEPPARGRWLGSPQSPKRWSWVLVCSYTSSLSFLFLPGHPRVHPHPPMVPTCWWSDFPTHWQVPVRSGSLRDQSRRSPLLQLASTIPGSVQGWGPS